MDEREHQQKEQGQKSKADYSQKGMKEMNGFETGKRFYNARTKLNQHNKKGMKPESIQTVYRNTGVPASSIGMYENGDRVPNMENAQKLADYYGVNVLWLLGQSNSPSLDENSQTVTKETGLSADAVRILKSLKKTRLIDSLNSLLESDGFMKMLKDFDTARKVNAESTESEETANLIDSLTQWGTDNGMDTRNNRVSDHQLIDMYLWKASEEIGNTFRQIMKGDKDNGKR